MIKLRNIVKVYDENVDGTRALDNVSLDIQQGEFVAIMGPSGSGKSTLLHVIGCMDTVTGGTYELDGIQIVQAKKRQLEQIRKEKIGFIFQHFALMDYYTAYENIELVLLAGNVKKKERHRLIMESLHRLGITEVKDKIPAKMSGGQRQRVAIARALVSGCTYILADEPTGALDQRNGQEVLHLLKELHREGKTIILVTHDEVIARQTNRIIHICDGRVEWEEVLQPDNDKNYH